MALKDKLMTLEDFKAVRDVDVASNSAQFAQLSADLDAKGLSADVKNALLACFQNVAWKNESDAKLYYEALESVFDNSEDFYDIWEWDSTFTGAGKLTRTNAAALDGGGTLQYAGVYLRDSEIAGNHKRGFVTLRGKAPIILESDKTTKTPYYPIPIPKTATKVTATVTPNTQRVALYIYRYDPTSQSLAPYTRFNTIGWHVGQQVETFEAEENLFLSFNCSVDSSFSAYTVEPEMNIVFE